MISVSTCSLKLSIESISTAGVNFSHTIHDAPLHSLIAQSVHSRQKLAHPMSASGLPSLPLGACKEFLGPSAGTARPSTAAQSWEDEGRLASQLVLAIELNDIHATKVLVRQLHGTDTARDGYAPADVLISAFLRCDGGDAAAAMVAQHTALQAKEWPMNDEMTAVLFKKVCSAGKVSLLTVLLGLGNKASLLQEHGWNGLLSAVLSGQVHVASVLLSMAQRYDIPVTMRENHLLKKAVELDHPEVVEKILHYVGQLPTSVPEEQTVAAFKAAKSVQVVRAFFNATSIVNELVFNAGKLEDALQAKDAPMLDMLLQATWDAMGKHTGTTAEWEHHPVRYFSASVENALSFLASGSRLQKKFFQKALCSILGFLVNRNPPHEFHILGIPQLVQAVAQVGNTDVWAATMAFLERKEVWQANEYIERLNRPLWRSDLQNLTPLREKLNWAVHSHYAELGDSMSLLRQCDQILQPIACVSAAHSSIFEGSFKFLPETLGSMLPSKFPDWPFPGACLASAAAAGNASAVRKLLKSATADSLHAHDDLAFRNACENGHLEVVRIFLAEIPKGRVEPAEYGNAAFLAACAQGHTHVVRELLIAGKALQQPPSHSAEISAKYAQFKPLDVSFEECLAFRVACERGHLGVVRLLETVGPMAIRIVCTGHPLTSNPPHHSIQASARGFESLIRASTSGSSALVRFLLTPPDSTSTAPIDIHNLRTTDFEFYKSIFAQCLQTAASCGHLEALTALLELSGCRGLRNEISDAAHAATVQDEAEAVRLLLPHLSSDAAGAGGSPHEALLERAAEHASLNTLHMILHGILSNHDLGVLHRVFVTAARAGHADAMVRILQSVPSDKVRTLGCSIPAAAAAITGGNADALRVMLVLFPLNPLLRSWCAGDGMLLAISHQRGSLAQELLQFELAFKQHAMRECEIDVRLANRAAAAALFEEGPPPQSVALKMPAALTQHAPLLERLPVKLQVALEAVLLKAIVAPSSVAVQAEHSQSLRSGLTVRQPSDILEELALCQEVPMEHTLDSMEDDFELDHADGAAARMGSPAERRPARAPTPISEAHVPALQLGYVFRESPQLCNMLTLATSRDSSASEKLAATVRVFLGEGGLAACPPPRRALLYRVMVAACSVSKHSMGSFFIQLFRESYYKEGDAVLPVDLWTVDQPTLIDVYTAAATASAGACNDVQLQQLFDELVWMQAPQSSLKLLYLAATCAAMNAGHWSLVKKCLFSDSELGADSLLTPVVGRDAYAVWCGFMMLGRWRAEVTSTKDHAPEPELQLHQRIDELFKYDELRHMPRDMPLWLNQLARVHLESRADSRDGVPVFPASQQLMELDRMRLVLTRVRYRRALFGERIMTR